MIPRGPHCTLPTTTRIGNPKPKVRQRKDHPVTGCGQVMRAVQQLYATVADWIKNPFNIQTIEMHNYLSCTATKSDATVGRTLMFATRFRDGRNPNWGKDENQCLHPLPVSCTLGRAPAPFGGNSPISATASLPILASRAPISNGSWQTTFTTSFLVGCDDTTPTHLARALFFPPPEKAGFLHANGAFARQRLNSPMISAFANVLKCKLNPTTAADVSALMSSLSVLTAKTVNK